MLTKRKARSRKQRKRLKSVLLKTKRVRKAILNELGLDTKYNGWACVCKHEFGGISVCPLNPDKTISKFGNVMSIERYREKECKCAQYRKPRIAIVTIHAIRTPLENVLNDVKQKYGKRVKIRRYRGL